MEGWREDNINDYVPGIPTLVGLIHEGIYGVSKDEGI